MARITDKDGKSWALMSCKDKAGRVYVRAYRNQWDATKKRSYVAERIQVGRLQSDSSVRISPTFAELFPDYQTGTWYWADRELVDRETFDQQFPSKPEEADISWSDENIRVGVTYAAWKTAESMGLFADLTKAFGAEKARTLLALAIYKLDGGGAMMNFEDWVPQVWLPKVEPKDGRRISEVLSQIQTSQTEDYFKLRYDRALQQSKSAVTLSFDSTSIATYSTTIQEAAWGHAKQNPELKQVNYMTVCDHATGDVVYAYAYDGSINDKAILPTIYLQMKNAGLSLENNILVTDRGFQSIRNTQTALNLELKFIQCLSLNEGAVRKHLQLNRKALEDPIAHVNPWLGISAVSVKDKWTETTDNHLTLNTDLDLHLYRNPEIAQFETQDLHRDVLTVLEIKNEQANYVRKQERAFAELIKESEKKQDTAAVTELKGKLKEALKQPVGKRIDPELWKRVKGFLKENKRAKEHEPVWAVNYKELSTAVEFKGCWAIRTNAVSDPFEALRIYRQREIIERGFHQLKNEIGGSRLESTHATYRGKLFVYTLAQALRMHMLWTARKMSAKNSELAMPEESMRKLFCQLQSVQARKHRTTNTFILGAVARRHRNLLALLGIEKLPNHLDRF